MGFDFLLGIELGLSREVAGTFTQPSHWPPTVETLREGNDCSVMVLSDGVEGFIISSTDCKAV